MSILLLVLGLVILTGGAELLVRGASRLASSFGISPLVVGLTVVAFGTSAPELAVSLQGALSGQSDVAVGNVVGSNIFNVLFILGISAVIIPLTVHQKLIRIDVPLMIGASILVAAFGWGGVISRIEGLVLTLGIVSYTVFAIRMSRAESKEIAEEYDEAFGRPSGSRPVQLLLVIGGLALLVLGSRWFVSGAVEIARSLGLSELVIGLTIVAAGTSLPEVATSIVAAIKGERDIAVGNVVGSNLFNIFAVLGLSSLIAPEGIPVSPAALRLDIPVMVLVALACLPVFFTGRTIARWEGAAFLGWYVLYTTFLVLDAIGSEAVRHLIPVVWVIGPLTLLAIAVTVVRSMVTGQEVQD